MINNYLCRGVKNSSSSEHEDEYELVGVKSSSDPKKGIAMPEAEVEVIRGAAKEEEEELLRTPLTQLEEGATATLC